MEIEPIGFKIVGRLTSVLPNKLYRWYKEVLSGYIQAHEDGEIMKHDLYEQGERKRVPILNANNIGASMAIDEKYIGDEFYTVLSNADTGKVAFLAQTIKSKEIIGLLSKFGDERLKVKTISRDLSPTYDWVCRQSFWNATQVADKFHVIRHVLGQLQQVRINARQAVLAHYKEEQEGHYKNEYRKQKQLKQRGFPYKIETFDLNEEILPNGETPLQLLARSRYLLFKFPDQHTQNQKQRAKVLFKFYPQLKTIYALVNDLRRWYSKKNIGKKRKVILNKLNQWYSRVKKEGIKELNLISAFIKRHEGVIINYFIQGKSNAIAEAINSKIQRFISSNFGIRDLDFFLFRVKGYFS